MMFQDNSVKTMNNQTIVHLSDTDAEKFMKFLEYYDTFTILLQKKVFQQKKATIALSFDHTGKIKTIQRADVMYSADFPDADIN